MIGEVAIYKEFSVKLLLWSHVTDVEEVCGIICSYVLVFVLGWKERFILWELFNEHCNLGCMGIGAC